MEESAIRGIQHEISQYPNREIEVADGWTYNQYNRVLWNDLSFQSLFRNSRYNNFVRKFHNISRNLVFQKAALISFPIKDVEIYTEDKGSYWITELYDLYHNEWKFKSQISDTIYAHAVQVAKHGGAFVKKVREDGVLKVKVPLLRNMVFDLQDPENSLILEKREYSPSKLRSKKKVWDAENIEGSIMMLKEYKERKGTNTRNDKIEVWECWGTMPKSWFYEDAEDGEFTSGVYIIAGIDMVNAHRDNNGETAMGMVLFKEETDKIPYKWHSLNEFDGTALSTGMIEEVEQDQVQINNLEARKDKLISLWGKTLLKGDKGALSNKKLKKLGKLDDLSLVELEEGKDITNLNLYQGQLPTFENLSQSIVDHSKTMTSMYSAITGDENTATKPLGVVELEYKQASTRHRIEANRFKSFWGNVYGTWLADEFKKNITAKEYMRVTVDSANKDTFDSNIANALTIRALKDGKIEPEEAELYLQETLEELNKTGSDRFITEFEKLKKEKAPFVRISTASDDNNNSLDQASLTNLLNIINAGIKPGTESIIEEMGEKAGISPIKMQKALIPDNQNPGQVRNDERQTLSGEVVEEEQAINQ